MAELAEHSTFEGYQIEGIAGRGGMGVVYRARDLALDRVVALKVMATWLAEDDRARRRFLRESRMAAAIEHPHVLPIYAAGEHEGVAYLVMRFVSGTDLRTAVRSSGPLPPARAARIVAQVAGALDAAHRAGLVHRDVKPANILFSDAGHVYLSDFGLSRSVGTASGPTRSGHWVGTAHYVAPEQIRDEHVDGLADVYALGGVLYFALTGEPPFARQREEATLWAHLNEPPPRARALRPELPRALDDVIARAMAKQPSDRFPTAGELGRAALAAVSLDSASDEATLAAPRPDAPRRRSRTRALLLAGSLALAGAAGAVALTLDRSPGDEPPQRAAAAKPPAASPREPRTTPLPRRPFAIAAVGDDRVALLVGGGSRLIWVGPAGSVRPGPRRGPGGEDLVAAGGSLYAAFDRPSRVLRVDARSGRRLAESAVFDGPTRRLAVGAGAVWVTERSVDPPEPDRLLKLDPQTLATVSSTPLENGARDVRVGGGRVWVASRDQAEVVELDPATAQVVDGAPAGLTPLELAYGGGAIWSANADATVTRIDARSHKPITMAVGPRPSGIEFEGDEVWVTSLAANTVTRIDALEVEVADPLPTCLNPIGLALTRDDVWVACSGDHTVTRIPRA